MGEFVFIKYVGADAGEVLCTMLDESSAETHELIAETERRPIGFAANPEEEPEDDPDDPDTD